jgi:hypothetical protein
VLRLRRYPNLARYLQPTDFSEQTLRRLLMAAERGFP